FHAPHLRTARGARPGGRRRRRGAGARGLLVQVNGQDRGVDTRIALHRHDIAGVDELLLLVEIIELVGGDIDRLMVVGARQQRRTRRRGIRGGRRRRRRLRGGGGRRLGLRRAFGGLRSDFGGLLLRAWGSLRGWGRLLRHGGVGDRRQQGQSQAQERRFGRQFGRRFHQRGQDALHLNCFSGPTALRPVPGPN